MRTALIALLVVIASPSELLAQAPKHPVYEVARASDPIKIDGRLDEPAWTEAEPVGPFVNCADGSPSLLHTEAKVLYDDKYIYFAFRTVDDNIFATMKNRDDRLWEEEVSEVFLQADPHYTDYIELEVNPLGAMLDIYLVDVRKPIPYDSWNPKGLKWAVNVIGTVDGKPGDKEWTAEIALPLQDVVPAPHTPPHPGDHWRMNLYHIEKLPKPALLAWSPTMKTDFHVPAMFGEITFK